MVGFFFSPFHICALFDECELISFKAIFSRLLARMIPSGSSAPTVGKPSITTQHIAIYRSKMAKTITMETVTETAMLRQLLRHHRSN